MGAEQQSADPLPCLPNLTQRRNTLTLILILSDESDATYNFEIHFVAMIHYRGGLGIFAREGARFLGTKTYENKNKNSMHKSCFFARAQRVHLDAKGVFIFVPPPEHFNPPPPDQILPHFFSL